MMYEELWSYREDLVATDIEGFDVEATDGGIGQIDEATYDVGASYVVVDTGPWIFGRKVMIPASAIQRIDLDRRMVWLGLTRDQIKDSPELDESAYRDPSYRERVGSYYRPIF